MCTRYGESPTSAHLVPFSVDGVVVVASVCLVEIAGQIRTMTGPLPVPAVSAVSTDTPAPAADMQPDARPDTRTDVAPDIPTDLARPGSGHHGGPGPAGKRTARPTGRPDTATAVARLRRRYPDMSAADIARRLGVTDRTVRRYLPPRPESAVTSAAGTPVAA